MKKIILIIMLSVCVLLGSSYAKAGSLQAGGDFGSFNGEGISTTYGGAIVTYGIIDALDITGRYEAGSYSGATLTFLTLGVNFNFRQVFPGTQPYATLGVSQVWANVPGWADSTTGYFYGGGITQRIAPQFLVNFDFRAHEGTYAGFVLNATTISGGLLMEI